MLDPGSISVYDEKLGLSGKMDELVDWAYRYDDDYSNEALAEIARLAKLYNMDAEKQQIPLLVLKARQRASRNDGTLPYEQMQLDYLLNRQISFGERMPYGRVEVYLDRDAVIISIDKSEAEDAEDKLYSTSVPLTEFMNGKWDADDQIAEWNEEERGKYDLDKDGYLESIVHSLLFYGG